METNILYYGDNLDILRKYIPDNSIDLIYLDPPFNSKTTYNILYKELTGELSQAQITAFEDTWQWSTESEIALQATASSAIAPQPTKELMSVLPNFVGKKTPMRAYLTMMCIRLIELKRVLKDTGSIYLHCDPTASHYLKILMDTIFGASNFRNEIIWKRKSGRVYSKNSFGQKNDILLFYGKSENNYFQELFSLEQAKEYIEERFVYRDEQGRQYMRSPLNNPDVRPNLMYEYKGYSPPAKGWAVSKKVMEQMDREGRLYFPPDKSQRISRKIYLDEYKGQPISNIWVDIPFINPMAKERLGYPTQKPETLLERIISASSNQGDILLDPFCGCGTALVAAQKLNRKWIGIDITHLAISTMKWRLDKMFPGIQYKVIGEPVDLAGAKELARQNKYQFQWWAVSLIGGQPYGDKKKGADMGIDGYLYFMDEKDKVKKAIISVKGGGTSVKDIRDLCGVIDREKAEMGLFLTLEEATKPMKTEAAMKGFYRSPLGKDYPRIQIVTIEELLQGKKPEIPPWIAPFQAPPVSKKTEGKAIKML